MTNEPIKIKAIDLVGIAVAAEIWFKKINDTHHTFQIELNKAKQLKRKLREKDWDEDAELFIDEMPF